MGDSGTSTTGTAQRAKPKAEPKALRPIRFKVGANIGSSRYEVGDEAPGEVIPPATRVAWITEGLIEEVKG